MAKKAKTKGAGEDQTPEEKIAALEAKNAQLTKDLKESKKEVKAVKPKDLTFETEEGKFKFVVPKFNMDNVEYDAAEVHAAAEEEGDEGGPNQEVLSKLVAMKSGIIELIED